MAPRKILPRELSVAYSSYVWCSLLYISVYNKVLCEIQHCYYTVWNLPSNELSSVA
jgi:hypothetical protein